MRRLIISFVFLLNCILSFAIGESEWVDMGTRTADEDIIYWSSSDFICSNRYTNGYSFADKGENGSTVGWGDITGQKTGTDISDFGGYNCPRIIAGNPKYDIVTALMGSPYRLPTINDVKELMDNVTQSIKVIGKRRVTPYGAPEWVQGQWQWHDAMLINGRAANMSISVKFDGHLASVITSDGYQWEGAWSYSDGVIHVWRLTLNVINSEEVLRDEKGYTYQKISNQYSSGEIKVLVLTSNINGNQLYIPLPTDFSTGTSDDGGYVISYHNKQTHDYWAGETYDSSKGNGLAYNYKGAYLSPRYNRLFIRAVKVDVGSGQRARKALLEEIQTLIQRCKTMINNNIAKSLQLKSKDRFEDYQHNASESNNIKNSKTLVLDKTKKINGLEKQIEELKASIEILQKEEAKFNGAIQTMKQHAKECEKSVFGRLMSVSFDKTLFDYKVSAKNLNNGKVEIQIYVVANKNTEKFQKDFWKSIEDRATDITKVELSKEIRSMSDPGYEEQIKGHSHLGGFFRHHFDKSKEQIFQYLIDKDLLNGKSYIKLSEVALNVNDSIRKAINDFSIIDEQGHTYQFAYNPLLSGAEMDKFYLDSVNSFIPLYRYEGDASAIRSDFIINVSSVSDGFYQWINPFLVNDEKYKGLFVCRFTLPYSESYTFSSEGHKQTTFKPSSKHSVNINFKRYDQNFGKTILDQLILNSHNDGYLRYRRSRW